MVLATGAALSLIQPGAGAATRPNLLFMMTDQQRWDTMSIVTPSLSTPNMDRIAKEGALFKWGYTSTPTCTPARAGILTGQKPWNHGSLGAVAVAEAYPFEMPVTLAALGYSTTSIGRDSRRREFCHFAGTPSSSLLKRLLNGEGVQQNDSLADG